MRKNIIYLIALAVSLLFAAGCEELPNGYEVDKDAVVLEAYGPNPVLRGAELKFLGQNLDKITSVILPAEIEISSSDFLNVTQESFSVIVPQECEPGQVKLVHGSNVIVAKAELAYTEPFSISSVEYYEENAEIAAPGDSVIVNGDYLYNIVKVGFANGASASGEQIGTKTRNCLIFAVPEGAVTGLIYVEDGNGNQLYSETEVKVEQPVVESVTPLTVAPGDIITITGQLLDQIVSLQFTGSSVVLSGEELKLIGRTKMEVAVPDDVHDGPLVLISTSKQELATEASVTVKVPSELQMTAEDGFKAGKSLTITGKDLKLVTEVVFSEECSAEFTYNEEDGNIGLTIPAEAKDGELVVKTAAGKTASVGNITLVKASISSLSATEVETGGNIVVMGEHLDLVRTAKIGSETCSVAVDSETQITITAPASPVEDKLVLIAANSNETWSGDVIKVTSSALVNVTSVPSSVKAASEITIEGSGFNLVESIWLGEAKVTSYSSRSDNSVTFTVPALNPGNYTLKFILTTGEEEICKTTITVQADELLIWEGTASLDADWGDFIDMRKTDHVDYFGAMEYGAVLNIEVTGKTGGGQIKFADMANGWADMPGINGGSIINVNEGAMTLSYKLPDATVDNLKANGTYLQGKNATITKIFVTYPVPSEDFIPVKETDLLLINFEDHYWGSWSGNITENADVEGIKCARIIESITDGWLLNCNHYSTEQMTIDDINNYDIAFDILMPEGWTNPGVLLKLVIADHWLDLTADHLSSLKGEGKWQTVVVPMEDFASSLEGVTDFSPTNGMYMNSSTPEGLPVGTCLSNLRLILK